MCKGPTLRPLRLLVVVSASLGLMSACGASDIFGADPSCASYNASGQCASALQSPRGATPTAGTGGMPAVTPVAGADAGTTQPTVTTRPDAGSPSVDAGTPTPDQPDAATADSGAMSPTLEDVPTTAHCAPAADWEADWSEFETEVLRLTNEARAKGADCGQEGKFGATTPLKMSPILRCSARLHSADMGEKNYFDHTNREMLNPFQRMMMAGYSGQAMGENIAKGQQDPAEVVSGWIDSDGHCRNIMDPMFTEIGIGYWQGKADNQFFNGNKLWTQNFGRPRGAR